MTFSTEISDGNFFIKCFSCKITKVISSVDTLDYSKFPLNKNHLKHYISYSICLLK